MLELSCGYTNHMELEDCFILGDFGVDMARAIMAAIREETAAEPQSETETEPGIE